MFGFPDSSVGKESACNAEDLGSIPGLGRSPGEGRGYLLQYSGLENSMDCVVQGVTKSQTRLSDFHFQDHVTNKWWNQDSHTLPVLVESLWFLFCELPCREWEPASILLELGHSRLAPLREERSLLFSKASPACCSCLGWRPWSSHRKPIPQRQPDTAPSSFWACFRKPQPASCVSPLLSQPHHIHNTFTALVTPDVGRLVRLSSSLSHQQSGLHLSSTLCFLINLFI